MRYTVGKFKALVKDMSISNVRVVGSILGTSNINMRFQSIIVFMNPSCILLENGCGKFTINNIQELNVGKNPLGFTTAEVFCSGSNDDGWQYLLTFS